MAPARSLRLFDGDVTSQREDSQDSRGGVDGAAMPANITRVGTPEGPTHNADARLSLDLSAATVPHT